MPLQETVASRKSPQYIVPFLIQVFTRNGKTPDADTITKTNEAFEFLNTFLEGQDWLAGSNITIADFAVVVNVSLTEVSIQFELS
jgi:glutathione S-transferase